MPYGVNSLRFRSALAANRAAFFRDVAAGPFYGFNRDHETTIPAVIDNWWRQGMMGSAKAHYDGIKAFSETDQTADLQAITIPTLVLHGDDDPLIPVAAGRDVAALVPGAAIETFPGWGHNLPAGFLPILVDRLEGFLKDK